MTQRRTLMAVVERRIEALSVAGEAAGTRDERLRLLGGAEQLGLLAHEMFLRSIAEIDARPDLVPDAPPDAVAFTVLTRDAGLAGDDASRLVEEARTAEAAGWTAWAP